MIGKQSQNNSPTMRRSAVSFAVKRSSCSAALVSSSHASALRTSSRRRGVAARGVHLGKRKVCNQPGNVCLTCQACVPRIASADCSASHSLGSRVETRRFHVLGKLNSRLVQPRRDSCVIIGTATLSRRLLVSSASGPSSAARARPLCSSVEALARSASSASDACGTPRCSGTSSI
jgi:hypothetical protein